jgi:hypothetical protein
MKTSPERESELCAKLKKQSRPGCCIRTAQGHHASAKFIVSLFLGADLSQGEYPAILKHITLRDLTHAANDADVTLPE